jgi:hypothetical protein
MIFVDQVVIIVQNNVTTDFMNLLIPTHIVVVPRLVLLVVPIFVLVVFGPLVDFIKLVVVVFVPLLLVLTVNYNETRN